MASWVMKEKAGGERATDAPSKWSDRLSALCSAIVTPNLPPTPDDSEMKG